MTGSTTQLSQHVLVLSDGRPGHFRQSEGVAAALERLGPIKRSCMLAQPRIHLPLRLEAQLLFLLGAHRFLKLCYPDLKTNDRVKFVISAGGKTLCANVAFARATNALNIFSGSTRMFGPEAFSVHLMPKGYDNTNNSKTITVLKPTPFDPSSLSRPIPFEVTHKFAGLRIGILIGGPTPSANFMQADYLSLIDTISRLGNTTTRLTFATSPRTPSYVGKMLAEAKGHRPNFEIIDFLKRGTGSIDAAFDSDLIFVTSDSMSMITEAAVSQRPAIVLEPRSTKSSNDDKFLQSLLMHKLVSNIRVHNMTDAALASIIPQMTPMKENHLDLLATAIAQHLDTQRSMQIQ